jgi:hypothetical protein
VLVAVAGGQLRRLFWRVADDLDYLWTVATLRILDRLAGPEPETAADQQWKRDPERLERAFPEICHEEPNRLRKKSIHRRFAAIHRLGRVPNPLI